VELCTSIIDTENDVLVVELLYPVGNQWVSVADKLIDKGMAVSSVVDGGEQDYFDLEVQDVSPGTTHLECCASTWTSPDDFHIQLMSDVSQLQELMDAVQQAATTAPIMLAPKIGLLCLALFIEDSEALWYRGRIMDVYDDGRVSIYYVDFGNTELIDKEHIRTITASLLNLPAQAIPCRLSGIIPTGHTSWSEEACQLFCGILNEERLLQVEIVGTADSALILNVINPPVADELVRAKFARFSGPVAYPPAALPQPGDVFRGSIVHTQTPSIFHVKRLNSQVDQKLNSCLAGLTPEKPSSVRWKSDDCCCAHYYGDNNWHRVIIMEEMNIEQYQVYYVDYGNVDIVGRNDIVPVSNPELFTIPQQVLCCQIYGVTSTGDSWVPGAASFFYSFVMDCLLTVEVKTVDIQENTSLGVTLTLCVIDRGQVADVGAALVANGYAVPTIPSLPLYSGPTYSSHPLPDENPFRMVPVCVQNDGIVVGQVDGGQEELEGLMSKVQQLCCKSGLRVRSVTELQKGQPCCAKFSEDNLWYRAVVDGISGDNALVCYIDYGNCETIPVDSVIVQPACLEVPAMSISILLANMESFTWNELSAQRLSDIVCNQTCMVTLKEPKRIGDTFHGSLSLSNGSDVVSTFLDNP
jgi:tudor domain-containing protein 1/4/6/7